VIKQFYFSVAYCLLFRLLGVVFSCNSCSEIEIKNNKKESIEKIVKQEITLHPKATLLDLYKNFFQGRYGPGHIIKNLDAAKNYLLEELQNATEFDSVLWQVVGYEDCYYRVNISLVRDGKISVDELITAFTESANFTEPPSLESWRNEWNSILIIIEQMNIVLPNFEQDKLQILENLEKEIVVGHHSAIYKENYHPHYRIVTKEHFEKLF